MNQQKEIRLITSTQEFASLHKAWNELLGKNHIQSAILSWEWLFSWWEVFGENKNLWLVTVWEAETLVGIAPLMLEQRVKFGLSLRTLCSLAAPQNDIGGYLVRNRDVEVVQIINNYIFRHKKDWDIFELNEFREDSLELSATRASFQAKDFFQIEEKDEHYHVPTQGNWEEYHQSLSAKFRKNLRRAQRNSQKLGQVDGQYFVGEPPWENFEEMIAVNCHAHFPTICNDEKEQLFLKKLHQRAQKWLMIYLLTIDGEPIAYEYGFIFNNRLENWRAGFDTRINPSVSVGKFATLKILQDAFEKKIREVDFMRGAHSYKREWKPSARIFVRLRFFRRTSIRAWLAYFGLQKIKPILNK